MYQLQPEGDRNCRSAWKEWIESAEIPWDWFVTITFERSRPRSGVWKAWSQFVHEIKRRQPDWSRRDRRTRYPRFFGVIEGHASGALHLHALVADVEKLDRSSIQEWLWIRFGRSEVAPFDPSREALRYLLKQIRSDSDALDVFLSRECCPSPR